MIGVIFVGVSFHVNQVNHAADVFLKANRKVDGDGVLGEALVDTVQGFVEIATDLVDFVDETDAGDAVFGGLAPNGFGLRFNTHLPVKDDHSAVQNAQGALNFGGEVNVTRGVNDVDFVPLPVGGDSSGGDGDAAFLFLFHPVGGGTAIVALDEADFMFQAGAIENRLGSGGFTGVNMGNNTDITQF